MRILIYSLLLLIYSITVNANTNNSAKSKKYTNYVCDFDYLILVDKLKAEELFEKVKLELRKEDFKYATSIVNIFEVLRNKYSPKYSEGLPKIIKAANKVKPYIYENYDALNIYLSSKLIESDIYVSTQQYIKALRVLYDLDPIASDLYKPMLVEIYNNMSSIFSEINETKLAQEYLEQAYAIGKHSAEDKTLALMRMNLASIYYNNFKFDDSIQMLEELSYILNDQDKYIDLICSYYFLKASDYYKLNQFNKAFYTIRKAFECNEEDTYTLSGMYLLKAQILNKLNRQDSISYYMNKSIAYVNLNNDIYEKLDTYKVASELYKNLPDSLSKYNSLSIKYAAKVKKESKIVDILTLEKRKIIRNLEQNKVKKSDTIWYISFLLLVLLLCTYLILTKKNKSVTKKVEIIEINKVLIEKIENVLERDKIYLKSDVNLANMAKLLETNTSYLSKAINQKYNKSFVTLMNYYRINYAMEIMKSDIAAKYTIESIAKSSGFKSLSAFYTAFKNNTGTTPSDFIKRNKEEKMLV